ncbi:hypothetical protein EC957_009153 [Mortierella hygrophila]|uniref:Sel1 repeat family protein n=1 Tax=Mortierella hygrophila TaxID=979708 RepID=A0A9P6K8E6_9FUNG|nr:hypothetical protein EC957_009153 [Mortierella hygrophila]
MTKNPASSLYSLMRLQLSPACPGQARGGLQGGKGGYQQSYLAANGWFLRAAQQEDSTAHSKAAFWYNKAAHNGSAKAQSNLGFLYIKDDGVEKNNKPAMLWLGMAVKQGNASTQFNLGCMYYMGDGAPVNYDKAMAWFSNAAKGGHSLALQACKDIQDERTSPNLSY